MSANLRYYVTAMFELDHVLRQVPRDAWDRPSPCDGWTARDVAGHAIAVVNNIPAKLGLAPALDPFGQTGAIAGDDPAATFRPIKALTLTALDREGALATTIASRLGDQTVDEYLVPLGRDAVVHAWDIARATGLDEALDPDVVAETLDRLEPAALQRSATTYGEPIEIPADAPALWHLLAATGRDPRR